MSNEECLNGSLSESGERDWDRVCWYVHRKIFWVQEIAITRFNELNDRNMAEYYLISTLLSITFALIIGIITRLVIEGGMIYGVRVDGCRMNCYTIQLHQHPKPSRSLNRESTFMYQHE